MHLLFAINDAYVPHVATTLCSVFENNRDMHFDVHVLATEMEEGNQARLQMFAASYHQSLDIRIIDPQKLEIDHNVCGKWGIYPSLKLYAADFFPNVDRMLYMDADMICIGSLQYLERLDLSGYYFAAVTDEASSSLHKQRLGLPDDAFYGCAGLVMFNLSSWRKNAIRQKCFEYFNDPKNQSIIKFGEQDVLNVVCQGHILELPIEYNMFSHYWLHHGNAIPHKYKSTIAQHRKDAVIIHYIDSCKPWFKDNRFPLKRYYWKYHSLTPWKDEEYGYSETYEGSWIGFKNSVKDFLHRLGVRKDDYAYDC